MIERLFYPIIFILLWSSGVFFVANGLHYNTPAVFLMLRFFIAAIIFLTILLYKKIPFQISFSNFILLLIAGIFIQFLYLLFFFKSLTLEVSPGLLMIILGVQPIFTAILTRNNLRFIQWAGLILGLIGLILVVIKYIYQGKLILLGIIYAFLAMLCITIGTILQKRYGTKVDITLSLLLQNSVSFLLSLCLVYEQQGFQSIQLNLSFLISLLWMSIVISIFANYLLYFLLRKGKIISVASFFYCIPQVSVLLDKLILGHTLPSIAILGMLLIVTGLLFLHLTSSS